MNYKKFINIHNKLDCIHNDSFSLYEKDGKVDVYDYELKNTKKYEIFRTSDQKLIQTFSKSLYPDHVIFLGPGLPVF